jgi:hypothetical protein
MYCKNCGSQLADDAKFCPGCGQACFDSEIPTPAPAPVQVPQKRRKKSIFKRWWFWVIIGFVVTALAVALGSGDASDPSSASKPNSAPSSTVDPIKVSASELRNIYDENEIAADKKYTDQLVAVTGSVDSIGTDIMGTVYITLDTGSTLKSVQCFFEADKEIDKVAEVHEGQEITAVGTCTGLTLTNVLVKDCSITNMEPVLDPKPEDSASNSGVADNGDDVAIEITAKDLFAAYNENEVAADNQYKRKTLKITGTVANIGTDILDKAYITLETGELLYSVQCYFANSEEEAKVANLSKGDTVTLIGTCDGKSLNVTMKKCKLQ